MTCTFPHAFDAALDVIAPERVDDDLAETLEIALAYVKDHIGVHPG